jgi:pimeloyl-ACP methyl ester carboxylesterase
MSCARRWIVFFAALAAALANAPLFAAPCIEAVAACTELVRLPGVSAGLLVYRSYALETRNESITRALVVVHGLSRDADSYYRSALAAAFLAGALDDTLIVVPRFAAGSGRGDNGRDCRDKLASDEIGWACAGKEHWKSGGHAVIDAITSFDALDQVLRLLAVHEVFPSLKSVVVAGHSAGGQFTSRYAMANRIQEAMPWPVSYVVMNPSSYTYPDKLRPTTAAMQARYPALALGYQPVPRPAQAPFVQFAGAKQCTGYDNWPYGVERRSGYAASIAETDLRRQLVARPVTYLLGELDILPLYGFDGSCSAMAQGPTRLARGIAYAKYVDEVLGAHHRVVIVPACGHNARCMLGADASLPVLFPKD